MPRKLARAAKRNTLLDITSLAVSFIGLVALTYVIWRFKTGEGGASRVVYLATLALACSFYPIGNVFIGYVITTVQVRPEQAYLWVEPLIRLLALPVTVFSLGRRLLGARIATLGLLFYLGTPSILFNLPVQQGMG